MPCIRTCILQNPYTCTIEAPERALAMNSPMLNSTRIYRLEVAQVRGEIRKHGLTPGLKMELRKAMNRLSAHTTRKRQRMEHASLRAQNELLQKRTEYLTSALEMLRHGIINSDCSQPVKDTLARIAACATGNTHVQHTPDDECFSLRDVKNSPVAYFDTNGCGFRDLLYSDSSEHAVLDDGLVDEWCDVNPECVFTSAHEK